MRVGNLTCSVSVLDFSLTSIAIFFFRLEGKKSLDSEAAMLLLSSSTQLI